MSEILDATVCMPCATYMHTGDTRALAIPAEFAHELDEKLDAMAPFKKLDWTTLSARPAGGLQAPCAVCGMKDQPFTVTVRNAVARAADSRGGFRVLEYPCFDDTAAVRIDVGAVEANATALFGWRHTGDYDTYVERLAALTGRKARKALDRVIEAGYGSWVEDAGPELPAVEHVHARAGRHYLTCDGRKLRVTNKTVEVRDGNKWAPVSDDDVRAAALATVALTP